MNTRPLTTAEQTRLNVAWKIYVDRARAAIGDTSLRGEREALTLEGRAWKEYKDTLDGIRILPTLAGYRVISQNGKQGKQ